MHVARGVLGPGRVGVRGVEIVRLASAVVCLLQPGAGNLGGEASMRRGRLCGESSILAVGGAGRGEERGDGHTLTR